MGGVCVDVFGGDALRMKRNPSSSFFLFFQISFHLRRRAASFLTWARLIRSLGAPIDARISRSASLLSEERQRSRRRPSTFLSFCPRMMRVQHNWSSCSLQRAAIITPNRRRAAGTAEATAALRELAAHGGKKRGGRGVWGEETLHCDSPPWFEPCRAQIH